jgi:inosine-uridine nucleoside N-ribohydrolase
MEFEPMPFGSIRLVLAMLLAAASASVPAQLRPTNSNSAKIIIDTDVGDDVDDAFAIDFALASPEFQILGISTAWGDTAMRAQMVDRMLCETGRTEIKVNAGIVTRATSPFSQIAWARAGITHRHGDAVGFLLDQIKTYPGEITLIALGPLTNIGAAIDRDPATFRKLKRVVLMGGSIFRGYDKAGSTAPQPAEPEYNIARDPTSALKLFRSAVPIFVLPLDSTQIKFDQSKRSQLAAISTPMTDSLEVLIAEWSHITGRASPTLFDAVAVAYALDESTCLMSSVHIDVDGQGMTHATPGVANAEACLAPREDAFLALLMPRLLHQRLVGNEVCLASPPH